MYKWIKLMVDILFLIVGMMILAYLHLLNSSRPTRLHDSVLPAAPQIAWMTHDSPLLVSLSTWKETTHRHFIPTEATHG